MKKFHILFFTMFIMLYQTLLRAAADHNETTQAVSIVQKPFKYYSLPMHIRQSIADFAGFNTPNKYGWLPLQAAVANGKLNKTLFLLIHGAHANLQNDLHPTSPLSFAASYNYSLRSEEEKCRYATIAKHLLYNGANPYLINEQGQTAIHEAVISHNISALNAMIKSKANLDVKNKFNQTPYDLAQTLAMHPNIKNEDRQNMMRICRILDAARRKSSIV